MKNRKRILIVDDEPANRELLEAFLSVLGHDTELAVNGIEALEKLNESHDLVLLDVMMPGIDGFEVARRIREGTSAPSIPICMVTALSEKEQRLRAVECGVNDFISKPIDQSELRIRINSLLKAKETQDTIKEYQAKLEEQNRTLQKNLESLEKASELKDEFIRIASHDLKNPLTCILGFATVVKQLVRPGTVMTEGADEYLSRIILHTKTMSKIISDFLDFQLMEEGHLTHSKELINLNQIVQFAIDQNSAYAKIKEITIHSELTENLAIVKADASQIGQVIDNLLSNALKFSRKKDSVTLRTFESNGDVIVEVIDNGPGLTEKDLSLLFVKYAKLSNKPTGGEKSSGLGLAICKTMIELNGGKLGGRNHETAGSVFWFSLPVGVPSPSSI